jgi:hypothetical protein
VTGPAFWFPAFNVSSAGPAPDPGVKGLDITLEVEGFTMRWLQLSLALLFVLVVAGFTCWLIGQGQGVNPQAYARLGKVFGKEVSLTQLEDILGGPATYYGPIGARRQPVTFQEIYNGTAQWEGRVATVADAIFDSNLGWVWEGPEWAIAVYMNDSGRLAGLDMWRTRPQTFRARVRRWLCW